MIRVALYQDERYNDLLFCYLSSNDNFTVIGLNTLQSVEKQIQISQPNVLLLDISLKYGLDTLMCMKRKYPEIKVIILSDSHETAVIMECVRIGIDGYIIKKNALPHIAEYIGDAFHGGIPMSSIVLKEVFNSLSISSHTVSYESLTRRETEILTLLVEGLSYKLLSARLYISIDTVRSHIKNIYGKLKVNSKSEAVVLALKEKLVL